MHRIDGPGSVAGHWSNGNPYTSPPTNGTIATGEWLEAMQEEVAAVVEASGRVLDKADNGQLLPAIQDLIAGQVSRRRLVYAAHRIGGTSLDVLGHGSVTLLGTLSEERTVRGVYLGLTTPNPATQPEDVGVFGPYDVFRRRWNPDVTFKIDTNTVVGSRLWFGLFSASPAALTDPASITCAAFRYENGVDGSVWKTCTSDGVSSTVKATNASISTNTSYELRVRHAGGGRFEFLVDGALVNAHDPDDTEIVPALDTNMGPVAMLRHLSDNNAKLLRFAFWSA